MPDEEKNLTLPEPEEETEGAGAGEQPETTPAQEAPTVESVEQEKPEEEADTAEEADEREDRKPTERTYPKSVVDKLIENRLNRDRRVREEELSRHAGVKLTHDDVKNAVALWGFLIRNPEINTRIGQIMQEYVNSGRVNQAPQDDATAAKEKELALKEAVIDLRSRDRVFRKYEAEIREWAELSGYEIEDPKTLRLAVAAWKGENMAKFMGDAQKKAEEEAAARARKKQDAGLLPGKGVRAQVKLDYRKMTPQEILKAEGLSLFEKDEP